MKKKAQESEAALRSLLASSEVGESPAPREGGGHIGSLKIREVEGGVMDAPGTAFCPGASQHTLGYVLHRALHI